MFIIRWLDIHALCSFILVEIQYMSIGASELSIKSDDLFSLRDPPDPQVTTQEYGSWLLCERA